MGLVLAYHLTVCNEIFCSNRRYIMPTFIVKCNMLSGTVVRTFAWHVRGPRFDPQLGKIIICIFFISCYYLQFFSLELNSIIVCLIILEV